MLPWALRKRRVRTQSPSALGPLPPVPSRWCRSLCGERRRGVLAVATGVNATAIGPTANATFANSTAVGTGATTTRANQVVLDTAGNTYTMPGIASAASLGAQSGPTAFVTTDANGNLATSSFKSGQHRDAAIPNDASPIPGDDPAVAGGRSAHRGIAAAVAAANPSMPSAPGRTTWQIRGSTFHGEYGVGVGFQHRLNTAVPLSIVGGYGNGGGREHTAYLGFGGEC